MSNAISDSNRVPTTAEDKRPFHRRRRSIIREFCLNTSTHALPGIARSESIHNRIFWSVSFICFAGIMVYFIVKSLLDYFDYPTQIDVSYLREWPQQFPAVSICNVSPLRHDKVWEPFLDYLNVSNATRVNMKTITSWSQLDDLYHFLIYKSNRLESLDDFFFPLSTMLQSCIYNSQPCSAQDFISFLSSFYGMCYTFNAKLKDDNGDSVRYANDNGGDGNLYLRLYIHSDQYIPFLTRSAGMAVLVHDNTQLPLIEAAGIELAPGQKHKLSYKKKATYFLSSPYTNCTDDVSPSMRAMLENYDGADYEYSETICYQLCEQAYVYEQCGCVNPNLWNARSIVKSGSDNIVVAPLCDINDLCFYKAANALLVSASLMDQYCKDCSQQCTITNFIVQQSSTRAPLEWEMETIKVSVENSSDISPPVNWSVSWREYIYADYLAINIIRETDIVETNSQSSSIGLVDVLSNIGGQTGLWIGISFLSIMEFIEMIYRLLRHQFHIIRLSLKKRIHILN